MQIGLSMSKVYDPQSNVSMPLTASLLNAMFVLIFFVSNGHLTMIRIFTQLCVVVPYQGLVFHTGMFWELVQLFSLILIYAVKMALPILAAEMINGNRCRVDYAGGSEHRCVCDQHSIEGVHRIFGYSINGTVVCRLS